MSRLLILSIMIGSFAALSFAAEPQTVSVGDSNTFTKATSGDYASVLKFSVDEFSDKSLDKVTLTVGFNTSEEQDRPYVVIAYPVKSAWTDQTDWSGFWEDRSSYVYEEYPITAVVSPATDEAIFSLHEVAHLWTDGIISNNGLLIIADSQEASSARIDEQSIGQVSVHCSPR